MGDRYICLVVVYLLALVVASIQPRPAVAASDPVIVAAGDIACNGDQRASQPCKDLETSELLLPSAINPDAVLALGDLQYENGLYGDFLAYFDRSWGRVKDKIYPVPGNHEYYDATCSGSRACGYFDYFNGAGNPSGRAGDRDKGYYAFTLGAWRIYAINSNCARVSCAQGSPQERWLRQDLAEYQGMCQLMFMHHPYVASTAISPIDGRTDTFDTPAVKPLWQAFYDAGGDVVLAGHSHLYERFAPLAPDRSSDGKGIRQFVVGTGGKNLWRLATAAAGSEVQNDQAFGVLKLTLHPESYDWEFVPIAGQSWSDAGTGQCHPDTIAPNTTLSSGPSGAFRSTSATFGFSSSEPDSTFECSLDGAPFAACTSPKTYTGLAQGTHTFQVRAIDAAGNVDPTPASRSWRVDTLPPGGSITINGGAGYTKTTSVTLSISAADPAPGSGVLLVRFRNAGDPAPTEWESYTTRKAWILSSGDGEKTVYVRFKDAAGNISGAVSDQIALDTASPEVTAPSQELLVGAALGTTAVPVRLRWSGGDATSGVARYQLQQRRYVHGAWQPWSWVTSGTTATRLERQLDPGRYQFRVRAVDRAGNWSPWRAGAAFTLVAYQERSRAISYSGSWSIWEVPSAYGGYTQFTGSRGYAATFQFRGRQVAWVAPRAGNRGYAYVYLDGVKLATVNLYSSSYLARRLVYVRRGLDPSVRHTLRVYVTGAGPADSTGTRVDVDAFLVLR